MMFKVFILAVLTFCGCFTLRATHQNVQIEQSKTKDEFLENMRQALQPLVDTQSKEVLHLLELVERFQESNEELPSIAWALYPKYLQILSPFSEQDPCFKHWGYKSGSIDYPLMSQFLRSLENAKIIPIVADDYDLNYHHYAGFYVHEERYSQSHMFYMFEKEQFASLSPIIESLEGEITSCIGSNWRVVNVRCWKTFPSTKDGYSQEWHKDGFPLSAIKLMIYPNGAGIERGSTELLLSDGTSVMAESSEPAWLIFKNSELLHRGVSSKLKDRLIIEITLVPSEELSLTPLCAGLNAQYPLLPWQYKTCYTPICEPVRAVNIGGSLKFCEEGWLNLEAINRLSPNCIFPLEDKSIQFAYTNMLQRFNQPTVYRILSETSRTLMDEGYIVIKIPNYDQALEAWKKRDASFFDNEWRFYATAAPLWQNRGLKDTLDNRASMLFLSYFTEGYFGPAVADRDFLQHLIHTASPSRIVEKLRFAVNRTEKHFQFCYQSAWGYEELEKMLAQFGFQVVSMDADEIIKRFHSVPEIEIMKSKSMYCLAKKIF